MKLTRNKNIFGIFLLLTLLSFSSIPAKVIADGDKPEPAESVPESLINLGRVGSYAIVVDKALSRLEVYQQIDQNAVAMVKTFRTSTGRAAGDKIKEGDLKTPEGIYYFVRIREDSQLLPKYGLRAFDLNYPNLLDRLESKTGHGIWLHGTDEPERLKDPRTSEGCVVLNNEDIKEISSYITLYRTPILISEKHSLTPVVAVAEQRKHILSFVDKWLESWSGQDLETYIGCYSEQFRGSKSRFINWKNKKKNVFSSTTWAQIDIDDVKVLKHADHIVVSFFQRYQSNLMDDAGIKWIYLQENGSEYQIIGENWYPIHKAIHGNFWNRRPGNMQEIVANIEGLEVSANGSLYLSSPQITKVNRNTVKEITGSDSDKLAAVGLSHLIIDKDNSEKIIVSCRVNNIRQEYKRRGWLYLIAEWEDNSFTAFPGGTLTGGVPEDPTRGDYYGIRWFKELNVELPRSHKNAELAALNAFIYDQNGNLISKTELPVKTSEVTK